MINITVTDMDLGQIATSGQCFRMREIPEQSHITGMPLEYEITAGDRILRAGQDGNRFSFACDEGEFEKHWKDYFDWDTDYSKIKAMADPEDSFMMSAIEAGSGIRILRQDVWEMIVTFLISQQNNITRITRCVENICRTYGKRMTSPYGGEYYAFPAPDALAGLDEDALMECNLGYRSKYVVRAAREVADGTLNIENLTQMSQAEARERLLKMYGIGVKVADCICLFGLHHVDAFPIDTHIRQIIEREYPGGFPLERYSGYAGIIQQYIFYYEINRK